MGPKQLLSDMMVFNGKHGSVINLGLPACNVYILNFQSTPCDSSKSVSAHALYKSNQILCATLKLEHRLPLSVYSAVLKHLPGHICRHFCSQRGPQAATARHIDVGNTVPPWAKHLRHGRPRAEVV